VIPMASAKLTSKGQITIPKPVREKLGLRTGSLVAFDPFEEYYLFKPLNEDPLDELEGFFTYTGQAHSIEEMNEAIIKKAAESFWKGG